MTAADCNSIERAILFDTIGTAATEFDKIEANAEFDRIETSTECNSIEKQLLRLMR